MGLHQPLGFGSTCRESVFPWVQATSELGFHHVTLHCHVPPGDNKILSVENYLKEVASCVNSIQSATQVLFENLHKKTTGPFDSYPQTFEEMMEMAEIAVGAGISPQQCGFVFDVYHMFQETNFDTDKVCQSISSLGENGVNRTLRNWIKVIHLCGGTGGLGHQFPEFGEKSSQNNSRLSQGLDVPSVVKAVGDVWKESRDKPYLLVEAGTWPGENPVYGMGDPRYRTDKRVFEKVLESTEELRRSI